MGALALHCKKNGNIYSSKTRTLLKKNENRKMLYFGKENRYRKHSNSFELLGSKSH